MNTCFQCLAVLLRMSGHCLWRERARPAEHLLLEESLAITAVTRQSRCWLLLWCHLLSWPPLPSCLSAFRVLLWSDCWHLGQTSYFLNYCFMGISNVFQISICLYATNILSCIFCRMLETRRVGFQNICIHTVSYFADRTKFPIENLFVLHIFYEYSLKIILFYS